MISVLRRYTMVNCHRLFDQCCIDRRVYWHQILLKDDYIYSSRQNAEASGNHLRQCPGIHLKWLSKTALGILHHKQWHEPWDLTVQIIIRTVLSLRYNVIKKQNPQSCHKITGGIGNFKCQRLVTSLITSFDISLCPQDWTMSQIRTPWPSSCNFVYWLIMANITSALHNMK